VDFTYLGRDYRSNRIRCSGSDTTQSTFSVAGFAAAYTPTLRPSMFCELPFMTVTASSALLPEPTAETIVLISVAFAPSEAAAGDLDQNLTSRDDGA
jgi:hypothetical protein